MTRALQCSTPCAGPVKRKHAMIAACSGGGTARPFCDDDPQTRQSLEGVEIFKVWSRARASASNTLPGPEKVTAGDGLSGLELLRSQSSYLGLTRALALTLCFGWIERWIPKVLFPSLTSQTLKTGAACGTWDMYPPTLGLHPSVGLLDGSRVRARVLRGSFGWSESLVLLFCR